MKNPPMWTLKEADVHANPGDVIELVGPTVHPLRLKVHSVIEDRVLAGQAIVQGRDHQGAFRTVDARIL